MQGDGRFHDIYSETCTLIARDNSKEVSLLLDQCDVKFRDAWAQVYESVKDSPNDAPAAAERLIRLQPQLSAVTLAIARMDSEVLFSRLKRTLELIIRSTERLPGYPAVAGIPHLQAGFLYMAVATVALNSEAWNVLKRVLTTKYEWYYHSGRAIFSYAFDLPYLFHSEALGRSGPKVHDFYRKQLQSSEIAQATNLSEDDALNVYLQVQMLMCLRVAQLREQGEAIVIWPDFGRFYGERIARLFDRAYAEREYTEGLLLGFGEDAKTFFARLNQRLQSIATTFFRGAPYFYESLTSWEPVHR